MILVLYSKLIIFIRYDNNSYCFIYYTQENLIFYSIHAIFDQEFFSKCTDSHIEKCKLYDRLLNKISLETELLVLRSSSKNRLTLLYILLTSIPSIQNNSSTHSCPLSLFYKSLSPSSLLVPKNSIVKVKEINNIDSDIEM